MKSLLSKDTIKAESVVPHKPVRTTQANLGRHCTHMHYAQFSQNTTHSLNAFSIELATTYERGLFLTVNYLFKASSNAKRI
jgi:hypothetical protein